MVRRQLELEAVPELHLGAAASRGMIENTVMGFRNGPCASKMLDDDRNFEARPWR